MIAMILRRRSVLKYHVSYDRKKGKATEVLPTPLNTALYPFQRLPIMIRQVHVVRSVCLRNSRLRACCLGSSLPGGAGSVSCALSRVLGNVHCPRGHSSRDMRNLFSSSPKSSPTNKPGEPPSPSKLSQMWQRFLEPKEMPKRYTTAWYKEVLLICTVFAVTGSSTMVVSVSSYDVFILIDLSTQISYLD